MTMPILKWDVYEIQTEDSSINGVMLRGRIRKLCLEEGLNVLTENTQDIENSVRFAVLTEEPADHIIEYLTEILPDVRITKVLEETPNPVLSKLKVNIEDRYTL
jgi:hypothetical protein